VPDLPTSSRSVPSNRDAHSEPDYKSLEAAANWYAILHCEEVTSADHNAWQTWLGESAEHAHAWSCIEAVSRGFAPLRTSGHKAVLAGVEAARRGAGGRRQLLAGLFGLGIAGWLSWRHTALPELVMAWGADYSTLTGEQREIFLADGSQIWLNTNSALRVDFQSEARVLKLNSGEILVQTAPDSSARTFFVETRFGRMQALGTRFSVHHNDNRTRLDVFESTVEIHNSAGLVQRVNAGQRAEFTATRIADIAPAERAREAWRRGIIVADNIPLRQLIEELARYQRGYLAVAPEVAELSVMGVYPANDTERTLAMLENSLPITIKRILPWWVSINASQ
jgi:transmembrane sensor